MAPPSLPSDVNRGYILIIIFAFTITIALILLCLRLFVRTKIIRSGLGWDDFFILLAMIGALAASGMGVAAVHLGVGRHVYYLSPKDSIQAMKWNFIAQVPLTLSTMFARTSICIFLLRLFTTNIAWRRTLHLVNGFNIITSLIAATTILNACYPAGKIWNHEVPGSCPAANFQRIFAIFQGAASAFCDWALAFLPIVFLWNVQISFRVKVGICCLVGLGLFTGAFTLARTVLLGKFPEEDFTYNIVDLDICAGMEMMMAIIAACIPTIRPLFRAQSIKYLQSYFGKYRWNTHRNRNGYTVHSNHGQQLNHQRLVETPQKADLSFLSDIEIQHVSSQDSQADTIEPRATRSNAITQLPQIHLSSYNKATDNADDTCKAERN